MTREREDQFTERETGSGSNDRETTGDKKRGWAGRVNCVTHVGAFRKLLFLVQNPPR